MTISVHQALSLFLTRILLRSPLGDAEQRAILGLPAEAMMVDVGQDFVKVGERLTHACLIVDGLAARFHQLRDGQRAIVAFHVPGDMADLHSVVARNITWALQAVTPSRILRIPHEALHALTETYPSIGVAFWRDCVVDANILAQWTVNVARKDATARLCHLLSELHVRYRAAGLAGPDAFPLPITQANLADAVGLTPIHLNRVLQRLRQDDVVIKGPAEVVVHDPARLAKIGEFDPAYLQLSDQTLSKLR